jgi:hypothetical protein
MAMTRGVTLKRGAYSVGGGGGDAFMLSIKYNRFFYMAILVGMGGGPKEG